MEMASPWLVQRALTEQVEQNWRSSYKEVNKKRVPRAANVIGSHDIYKN